VIAFTDPLAEISATWSPFESGLVWATWCEEDRASELAEMLGDVRSEQLEAATFDGKYCVDPPAEIVQLPAPATRPDRSAA
jgi:hypothetical protein